MHACVGEHGAGWGDGAAAGGGAHPCRPVSSRRQQCRPGRIHTSQHCYKELCYHEILGFLLGRYGLPVVPNFQDVFSKTFTRTPKIPTWGNRNADLLKGRSQEKCCGAGEYLDIADAISVSVFFVLKQLRLPIVPIIYIGNFFISNYFPCFFYITF